MGSGTLLPAFPRNLAAFLVVGGALLPTCYRANYAVITACLMPDAGLISQARNAFEFSADRCEPLCSAAVLQVAVSETIQVQGRSTH